jgi:hypothetical protein
MLTTMAFPAAIAAGARHLAFRDVVVYSLQPMDSRLAHPNAGYQKYSVSPDWPVRVAFMEVVRSKMAGPNPVPPRDRKCAVI